MIYGINKLAEFFKLNKDGKLIKDVNGAFGCDLNPYPIRVEVAKIPKGEMVHFDAIVKQDILVDEIKNAISKLGLINISAFIIFDSSTASNVGYIFPLAENNKLEELLSSLEKA